MKKAIPCLAILILCLTILTCGDKGSNPVNSGNTWNILFNSGYHTELTKIIPTGSDYIVGGMLRGYCYAAKINNDGQILWEQKILEYSTYRDISMSLTSDNKVMLSCMSELGGLTQQKVTIFIVNQSGTVEDTCRFEIAERKENTKLVMADDTSVLLVKIDYYVTPHNIVFSKYALDGTLIWETEFENSLIDNIVKLIHTSDQGFLMAGWAGDSKQYLIKIDKNGNKLWEWTGEDKFTEHLSDFVIECAENGYLFTGFNNFTDNNLVLTKLNHSGSLVWRKQIDDKFSFGGCAVNQVSDGYMLAGSIVNNEDESIHDHCLIKVDNSGNVLWTKVYQDYFSEYDLYGDYTHEFSLDLCSASDGGFLVTGTVDFYYLGYIMKTDLSGNTADTLIVYNYLE